MNTVFFSKRLKQGITFLLLFFILLSQLTIEQPVDYSMVSDKKGFLVPFIRGQGLNNQLWEYRSSAIIAKATGRILCLEPFHRFYLQKVGRRFIPFEELFDINSMRKFVDVTSSANCAHKCKRKINRHVELITKPGVKLNPQNTFPIPNWRPGSLHLFSKSTGFDFLPSTELINVNHSNHGGIRFDSLENIRKVLSKYATDSCVSVLGSTPTISKEFIQWSKALRVNQNIKDAVNQIKKVIFEGKPYLAIHWRFEETKCAGRGQGIGFGRSLGKFQKLDKQVYVKKTGDQADLCFFAGPLPANVSKKGIWLRLVDRNAVVAWIKRVMMERKIENVYIATDCHDLSLLQWIKYKTGAKTKTDIEPSLSSYISLEENDIISRVEQQICTESTIFSGTSMSSWTSSVIEERFNDRHTFFIQDKYNFVRRPDQKNQTFYFDIEVCDCEWER